jgi:hypothetical protein
MPKVEAGESVWGWLSIPVAGLPSAARCVAAAPVLRPTLAVNEPAPATPPAPARARTGSGEPDAAAGDTLSEVLRAVRLNGAVFFAIDASAPWVAEAPPAREIGHLLQPGSEHVIEYRVVTRGSCWGGIVGEAPVRLETGDVLAFPQGDAHIISSAPGMRGAVEREAYRAPSDRRRLPVRLEMGDGGDPARLICGFLGCDARPFNPLLATLPRTLHVRPSDADDRLGRLVELTLVESETPRAGGECVLSREPVPQRQHRAQRRGPCRSARPRPSHRSRADSGQ